jgi:hypothetical protein
MPFQTAAGPVTAISNSGSDVALECSNQPPCERAVGAATRGYGG